MTEKVIGIDLGTTNSVIAIFEGNDSSVIHNPEGLRITPSVVSFLNKEKNVGVSAKNQAAINPINTIFSIKRFMGKRVNELKPEDYYYPFKITGAGSELVKIEVEDKLLTPPEISAVILQYLKAAAEEFLGTTVTKAVITVPAYFNDSQRQATKDAGIIAGLDVIRIINEPTAAALAYGLNSKKTGKVAVYDLGGGTFDLSILDLDGEVVSVLSTNGDTHLGGDDFDNQLMNFVLKQIKETYQVDLKNDSTVIQRLKEECENAKKTLSSSLATKIRVPFLSMSNGKPIHVDMEITRAKFEKMIEPFIEKTVNCCKIAMEDAGLINENISEVVLVGGSSRIPYVREKIKEIFNKEKLNCSVNPDEVVAIGAAIQGAILSGALTDVLLLDVIPLTLGIETLGGVMTPLISKNTNIPTIKKEVFSTAHDNQLAVDVHVLQGERPMASDNRSLSRFQLDGLPMAPRGIPKIEVTFNIDANGILAVSAKDLATNREKSIKVKHNSGLTDSEIERMKKEAEKYAEDDKKKIESANIMNQADAYIINTSQFLLTSEEVLTDAQKSKLKGCLNRLIKEKNNKDCEKTKQICEELITIQNELSEELYGSILTKKNKQEEPKEEIIEEVIETENIEEESKDSTNEVDDLSL